MNNILKKKRFDAFIIQKRRFFLEKVYLVRHGETDFSQKGIVQGQQDILLNDRGIQTAEKLGKYISDNYTIAGIVTSDLSRCVETSKIIVAKLNNKSSIREDRSIREVNLGIFEGTNMIQLEKIRKKSKDYNAYIPQNGESMNQMNKRVLDWFYSNYETMHNLLIVTHRGPISAILSRAENISLYDMNELLLQRKIIVLELNSGKKFFINEVVVV